MMWKCFEGPMAAQHTRCDNDRDNNCGDRDSLLGWDSADFAVQQNHAWIPYEADANLGDESKKTKEATGSLPACPKVHVNKSLSSSEHPSRQCIGSLLRLNKSFDNANVGGCPKKRVSSRRASMSLVGENECRAEVASNRSLRGKSDSCRSLFLGSKVASSRSLYRGMIDEDNGENGTTSDPSTSARANDASLSVPLNESCKNVTIPDKRGPPRAPKSLKVPKSLKEKKLLVENRIPPPVARKVSYLQLEIYLACDAVEDDAESEWAFKTPTANIESGPEPPNSSTVHMRAVWCLV
jgi:hypothetical protein